MFQRLDQLRTGSLFILTGQAGAGKSHLAASARRNGTVWVLDTEGASQSLLNKPGVHRDIQAVQTLSLRQLLDAMREIKRVGKVGDTVILDSISKVLQAMRQYAQQRAGAETDRKTSLSYDEHASINRNMQAIYTALTELKHAGFHIIIIGHLAKKYQSNGTALKDVGLDVLADANISYEADAVLLVERNGARRTITPINKPPRPSHLHLNEEYPATIATLYPDLAAGEEDTILTPTINGTSNVSAFPTEEVRASNAPKTAKDAERRFFAKYGAIVGGTEWADVEAFLGYESDKPTTISEWVEIAAEIKARNSDTETAAA